MLTPTLTAAAAVRGLSLLALDPASTPEDWRAAGVDVLVHKVPDEPGARSSHTGHAQASRLQPFSPKSCFHRTGLDDRLQDWADAAADGVLLDPPAAVRQLQDRQQMLAPLAGQPLVLTQAVSRAAGWRRCPSAAEVAVVLVQGTPPQRKTVLSYRHRTP